MTTRPKVRPSGYYWIRLTPEEGVLIPFEPEVARWQDEIEEWEVAGSDAYFHDSEVRVLSGRLDLDDVLW